MIPASQALLDDMGRWERWHPVDGRRDVLAERLALIEAAVGREARAEADATLIALREALEIAHGIIEVNPGEDVCRHQTDVLDCEGDGEDGDGSCADRSRREQIAGVLSDSDSAAKAAVERIEAPWGEVVAGFVSMFDAGSLSIVPAWLLNKARSLLEHKADSE